MPLSNEELKKAKAVLYQAQASLLDTNKQIKDLQDKVRNNASGN